MYSWWWVRLSPETCRVKPLRRIKTQLLHLVGLISLHISSLTYVRKLAINCYSLHILILSRTCSLNRPIDLYSSECLSLKMKAPWSFGTSLTTQQTEQRLEFLSHTPVRTSNLALYRGTGKSLARPYWKKQLKGRHFSSRAEVIAAAETWLDGQPSEFFF